MDICTSFSSGRLTVYLCGELDHHEARGAALSIEELLDEYLPRDMVLDMTDLSFMDSSGIALIVKTSRRVKAMGGRMWVENPGSQPQRVIDASGIDRLVPVSMPKREVSL